MIRYADILKSIRSHEDKVQRIEGATAPGLEHEPLGLDRPQTPAAQAFIDRRRREEESSSFAAPADRPERSAASRPVEIRPQQTPVARAAAPVQAPPPPAVRQAPVPVPSPVPVPVPVPVSPPPAVREEPLHDENEDDAFLESLEDATFPAADADGDAALGDAGLWDDQPSVEQAGDDLDAQIEDELSQVLSDEAPPAAPPEPLPVEPLDENLVSPAEAEALGDVRHVAEEFVSSHALADIDEDAPEAAVEDTPELADVFSDFGPPEAGDDAAADRSGDDLEDLFADEASAAPAIQPGDLDLDEHSMEAAPGDAGDGEDIFGSLSDMGIDVDEAPEALADAGAEPTPEQTLAAFDEQIGDSEEASSIGTTQAEEPASAEAEVEADETDDFLDSLGDLGLTDADALGLDDDADAASVLDEADAGGSSLSAAEAGSSLSAAEAGSSLSAAEASVEAGEDMDDLLGDLGFDADADADDSLSTAEAGSSVAPETAAGKPQAEPEPEGDAEDLFADMFGAGETGTLGAAEPAMEAEGAGDNLSDDLDAIMGKKDAQTDRLLADLTEADQAAGSSPRAAEAGSSSAGADDTDGDWGDLKDLLGDISDDASGVDSDEMDSLRDILGDDRGGPETRDQDEEEADAFDGLEDIFNK